MRQDVSNSKHWKCAAQQGTVTVTQYALDMLCAFVFTAWSVKTNSFLSQSVNHFDIWGFRFCILKCLYKLLAMCLCVCVCLSVCFILVCGWMFMFHVFMCLLYAPLLALRNRSVSNYPKGCLSVDCLKHTHTYREGALCDPHSSDPTP